MADASSPARMRDLLRDHVLVDGHNDLPWLARLRAGNDWDAIEPAGVVEGACTDLPRLRAGGVGAQFWSVYVPGTLQGHDAVVATLEQIDAVHRLVEGHADELALATSPGQALEAFATGRIASMLGAEGGHSIGCSLGALRALHRLGVRYLTLTHNHNVPWADSATDTEVWGGLSPFGELVVAEMNRIGMLVDLSHVSAGTMRHALDTTRAPVIFSHSCARALCDSPRNVPDDVLRRLPDNGGVAMVTFVPEFLVPEAAHRRELVRERARRDGVDPNDLEAVAAHPAGGLPAARPARIADVVAHVEHVVEVAGVDHVGLGGDYDGTDTFPEGLEDVTGYPRLLAALADRGWSDVDLAKLAGGNVLRAWAGAQDVAQGLAGEAPCTATWAETDGHA